MAKQNTVVQDVKVKMRTLQEDKAAQLDTIRQKQDEARAQIEAAVLSMRQATEALDVRAYEEALADKKKAQTALDMYSGRYEQIAQKDYISEQESDKVIAGLLAYEEDLAAEFKAAAADILRQLAKLHKDYTEAVEETESTLSAWQRYIHANYKTFGRTLRMDPLTGELTDRSKTPTPVHLLRYEGCSEAVITGLYLEKTAGLLDG